MRLKPGIDQLPYCGPGANSNFHNYMFRSGSFLEALTLSIMSVPSLNSREGVGIEQMVIELFSNAF